MKNVEPSVYLIAKTQIRHDSIYNWLRELGLVEDSVNRILDIHKTAAETLVEVAGRRCYMSFQPGLNPNVTRIRKDITEYIDNLLAKKDGSVLEHVMFTFSIEGVSRVFTGEMNRHRVGTAISEASMRYIRYTDIPYWVPTCLKEDKTQFADLNDSRRIYRIDDEYVHRFVSKEEAHRASMARVFEFVQTEYAYLTALWREELSEDSPFTKKKELTSAMRRIIPMGVATGGIWSGNIRALRHIFEMRCSSFAEEEILLVATAMLNLMREQEPILFGDFSTDELGFSKPKYSKV